MPTNVIPTAETFTLIGRDLHGALQRIGTTDEQDLAEHRPLKRDGAIVERMGWKATRWQAIVVFVGPNFRADLQATRLAYRKGSEGLLVHPLHGKFTVTVARMADNLDVPTALNEATLTIDLVENAVDPKFDAAIKKSPAEQVAALDDAAAEMQTQAAPYTSTGAVDAVATLATATTTYSAAALAVVQEGAPNAALDSMLGDITAATSGAIAAIEADAAASLDVDRWDAIGAAQAVNAAALDLADALLEAKPTALVYTTPAPMSLVNVAQIFYGLDGLARLDEIEANNPSVGDWHLLPAGTRLTMAPATV